MSAPMILLLLACTHTPPVLLPPVPEPADLGTIPPASGPMPQEMPDGSLLVGVEDWTRLKLRSRLLTGALDDRDLMHRGWSQDVERGNRDHAELDAAAHKNTRLLWWQRHFITPAVGVLAGSLGAGLPIAWQWADGQANR